MNGIRAEFASVAERRANRKRCSEIKIDWCQGLFQLIVVGLVTFGSD